MSVTVLSKGKEATYARYKVDAMPPLSLDDASLTLRKIVSEVGSKTWTACLAEANHGKIASMVDLGLRLLVGLGTPCDKAQATIYLLRATQVPTTSKQDNSIKAMAHALLLESLGALPHPSLECPSFEVLRWAEYHACQSMRLRPGNPLPANVMKFCHTFKRVHEELDIFDGHEDLWDAVWVEDEDARKADAKLKRKRLAHPTRYRCASAGCGIVTEKGAALRRCGGPCDPDHKPSYCSRECQIKDRPIHKEFCKPGARGPLAEGLLYEDHNEGKHLEIIAAQQFTGPDVTLPFRSPDGKLYHVTGKREVLKSLTLITPTSSGDLPENQFGVATVS